MKRLLLFVCAMFVGTAMAEPTNTSNSFPINELMQPDYRYLNSAIYPNTGVYDGDVTANAQYDWDLFSPTAGNYLPANSTTITTCTAGNFCAGATNIHYDSIDQGITSCSTLGDNSYTQSATGSTTETDCYKNCTVANANIAHATNVSGNDYYGNGTDTCSATACEGGYHTDNNACGANVLTITWANSDNPNTTCTYGGSITTPATAPTIPGKTFVGWRVQLPYTPIEYIESTGTQYINTGVQSSGIGLTVKTRVSATDLEAEYAICGRESSGGFELYFANNGHPRIGIYNFMDTDGQGNRTVNIYNVNANTINANTIYNITASVTSTNIVLDVDGETATVNRTPILVNVNFIDLFRHAAHLYAKIKMYYFKLYNNGVLVRDFIPVKDANGVACMYDRVSKQFFYNAGTGNFIAGPNL